MVSLIHRFSARAAAPQSEAATARDERLRSAFAAVPVGLALCGLDGRWLVFNDAAAEILGYARNELARVSLHDLTHPSDVQREHALLKKLHAGDVHSYRIEKRTRDKQSQDREVVITATMVRNRKGLRDAILYTIEKPQAKEASGRTADGLSNQILESLADTAVIRCDPRGTILGWNRGAQQMFGYSRGEIIGRNRRILYRDGDNWSESALEDLRLAEERQLLETQDFRRIRGGRELFVKVSLTPFAPDGTLRGFVEVIHAVSNASTETPTDPRREELEREVAVLRERLAALEAPVAPEVHWAAIDGGGALGVVQAVSRSGRSGMLLFVSDERQKSIQLEEGRIASVASNDPARSIGDRLVQRGVITDAQRNRAVEMATTTSVAIGRALVVLDILREEDVANALREKIEDEIAELGGWTEGRWTFVDRVPPGIAPIRAAIELSELRAFTRAEFVASRKGTRYHRESCTAMQRVRTGDRVAVISALAGAQRGLTPCRICV